MGCIQQIGRFQFIVGIHHFTTTGKFCYINQDGEQLYRKLMKEFYNLRWFIQHLVDEYEYQYGDNQWTNPLHESNWTYRTNKQFMKYVNFTLKEMTPEQMKINPIKPIIKVKTNEELDKEEGKSIIDEQEYTISNKEEEEHSTFSDMSKQDSESDINVDETQHQENPQTAETLEIHNTYNTTIHDKNDLLHNKHDISEDENIFEIETYEHYGEKIHETEESIYVETSQVLTVFNKTIHHEDDSSDDKSVIEIEPPQENGEQEIGNRTNSLLPHFKLKLKIETLKGS